MWLSVSMAAGGLNVAEDLSYYLQWSTVTEFWYKNTLGTKWLNLERTHSSISELRSAVLTSDSDGIGAI